MGWFDGSGPENKQRLIVATQSAATITVNLQERGLPAKAASLPKQFPWGKPEQSAKRRNKR